MIYNKSVINKNNYAGKSKNKRLNKKVEVSIRGKIEVERATRILGCSFGLAGC